ncbi:MAG: hypothetical protein HY355_03690 [Armatimonadetes bacterium]|nr:hypothetical protein [Armatimonadota bacterium]
MRILFRPPVRHDPRQIYNIHADRATGMTALQIAAKHDLPAVTVLGFLRSSEKTCGLPSPYGFRGVVRPVNAAAQIYWLGYIAASGRVFERNNPATLVLAIHTDDAGHIRLLLDDLVIGHPWCEFADSSLDGHQAYVRDRALVDILIQWGISAALEDDSIPIEFIPSELIPDFVRGYLEGSRHGPPFGGGRRGTRSSRSVRSLTLVGSRSLVEGLSRVLQSVFGTAAGTVSPFGRLGLSQVAFSPEDSAEILKQAYRSPMRTSPRAAKFVERFANPEGRRRRSSSKRRPIWQAPGEVPSPYRPA